MTKVVWSAILLAQPTNNVTPLEATLVRRGLASVVQIPTPIANANVFPTAIVNVSLAACKSPAKGAKLNRS